MTSSLGITEEETRRLVVDELELLTASEFEASRMLSQKLRVPIEQAVAERGRVPLAFLLAQVASSWDVGFTDLKVSDIEPAALRRIRPDGSRTHQAVAFAEGPAGLAVAMVDPRNMKARTALERLAGTPIIPFLAEAASIQRAQLLYDADLWDLLRRSEGKSQ